MTNFVQFIIRHANLLTLYTRLFVFAIFVPVGVDVIERDGPYPWWDIQPSTHFDSQVNILIEEFSS